MAKSALNIILKNNNKENKKTRSGINCRLLNNLAAFLMGVNCLSSEIFQ